ncbi:MAG: thioredoxin [Clostridia bacterium]|nr:thioredoxin [Clostridia bacterium]
MSVIHVTNENFEEVVMNSDTAVLVDFSATWCGPCQMIAPTIEEIADEYDEYTVVKIDVDDSPELAVKYGIVSIPTLIVIKNGEAVSKAVGLRSKEEILDMLD